MATINKLDTYAENTWCPGCGNFGILSALKRALTQAFDSGLAKKDVVLVSGIGCHAKIVDYVDVNSFYSLHGRVLPPATGIKVANPGLTVIGHAGDGDAYGEGISHLVFAAKRNIDVTLIVHNNRVYGLTTGQFTPTSPEGFKGRSTPSGSPEPPLNPLGLMLASGATFVARGYAGKVEHLKALILKAMEHKGFSFIDVLQPCYTFFNTYSYYNELVYEIDEKKSNLKDKKLAMELATKWNYQQDDSPIPIGIFFKEQQPTFHDELVKGIEPMKAQTMDVESFISEMT